MLSPVCYPDAAWASPACERCLSVSPSRHVAVIPLPAPHVQHEIIPAQGHARVDAVACGKDVAASRHAVVERVTDRLDDLLVRAEWIFLYKWTIRRFYPCSVQGT